MNQSCINRTLTLFSLAILVTSSLDAQWQQIGPYGGTVQCLLADSGNLFAGTYGGGVFFSSNNGANWTQVNSGLSNSSDITALINNGNTVFAAAGFSVFASTNNGGNWKLASTGLPNSYINCFTVKDSITFAGTSSNGVYLSTNSGLSWVAANNGITSGSEVYSLIVSGGNILAATDNGLFLSINNGASWSKVNPSLPANNFVTSFTNMGGNLFAGTNYGDVIVSSNNGLNWKMTSKLGVNQANVSCLASIGNYLFAGTDNFYSTFSSTGVYFSIDTGKTWSSANTNLPFTSGLNDAGYSGIKSLVVNGSSLFSAVGDNGVYISTNDGANWKQDNNGLNDNYVVCLASVGGNLFAGTNASNLYITKNSGATWTAINDSAMHDGLTTTALALEGNNLYASTAYDVYSSPDSGVTWTFASKGLSGWPISFAAVGINLFAGTSGNGVFLSTNNGASWTLQTGTVVSGGQMADVLALVEIGGKLIAGTADSWDKGALISTDNGDTWTESNSGLPGSTAVYSFFVYGSNLFAGTSSGICISTNYGLSWKVLANSISARSFVLSGSAIFTCSSNGVYYSVDNGVNWTQMNSGLTNTDVTCLAVVGNNLFAGTLSSSAFVYDISGITTSVYNFKSPELQASIYPNPGKDRIYVTSNSIERQQLQVFDPTGNLLISENMENGKTIIDANSLTQGVYSVCLTSEFERITKKLVIVK